MLYIYYRIKELCIKLIIKTSLYYDARSEKHHIMAIEKSGRLKYWLFYRGIVTAVQWYLFKVGEKSG
jgi:hypothetical protein